jgi:adenylate kinase family enzyme
LNLHQLKPRIHIIGGPGSGKSYVTAKLAQHFKIPVCDLDELFWDQAAQYYGIRADLKDRDRQLANFLNQDGWVIEGVYYQWLAPSFDAADVIVMMTPSIWIRHWRVVKRFILRRLGKIPAKRESVIDIWRLLRWSHTYDSHNLVQACKFVSERGRNLVDCKTFDDVLAATGNFTSK